MADPTSENAMADSSAESSDDTSETSTLSHASDGSSKDAKWWWPGAYFVAFMTNAAATAVLFPWDAQELAYTSCSASDKWFFLGLMLAAFGASCLAAFLYKRAGASIHARSAWGYAITNWIQSVLCAMNFLNLDQCNYGVVIYGHSLRL